MSRGLLAMAGIPLLVGCTTPYRGVSNERLWRLTIDRDRILISYSPDNALPWPRPRRQDEGGVRVWVAGGGRLDRIRIEARAMACQGSDGNRYSDTIRILRMVDGQPFVAEGCGGRLLR